MAEKIRAKLQKGLITADTITDLLPDEKQALKAILEETVSDNLKINVSPDEIRKITQQAKKINQAQKKLGARFGDVINSFNNNLEFLKQKKEMDDLMKTLKPSSKLSVATGTIGRGAMLTSIKSPVLNIGSNTVNGITEALGRRLATVQFRGANNKIALDYVRKVNKIYQATGYDISRSLADDFGDIGSRVLGDKVSAKGVGGVTEKVGNFFEDVTFKQLMGAPDVAFSSAHFADTVNLGAMKLAKGNRKKATKIMLDAMSLKPVTNAGKLLKAQGVLDAQVATWTNKSSLSKASEGLRKILNDFEPDARIGDLVLPFVKTPANVISTSIDYAGGGALKAVYNVAKMMKNKSFTEQGIKGAVRGAVRSGVGFTTALAIANQLKDDDFVGAYDPARTQIESLRNSTNNAIRIGDKWVSLDWLGPLGVPVAGIMYARKYGGDSKAGSAVAYSKGSLKQILNLPGFEELYRAYGDMNKKIKETDVKEGLKTLGGDLASQAYSRLVPSIFSDIAKSIDDSEREAKTVGHKIQAKIPVLRE